MLKYPCITDAWISKSTLKLRSHNIKTIFVQIKKAVVLKITENILCLITRPVVAIIFQNIQQQLSCTLQITYNVIYQLYIYIYIYIYNVIYQQKSQL